MRPKETPPRSAKKVVVVAIMPILRLRSANTWRISYQELLARKDLDESTWDENHRPQGSDVTNLLHERIGNPDLLFTGMLLPA